MTGSYSLIWASRARKDIAERLPEKVATAAFEFIVGALAGNPHRVGKQLDPPLFPLFAARRSEYRVLYQIDDDARSVEIVTIQHRRDAYRV